MGMTKLSVAEEDVRYLEGQVGDELADTAAVVADLIRRDKERRMAELRQRIAESIASGVSDRTMDQIFAEAVEIAKARGTYRD